VKALALPESMLVKAGDKASVWRIKANALNKVDLSLGARDARTGNYEIRSGLAEGDIILRTPSSSFKDGQPAEMVSTKPAQAASAPTASASAASAASATAAVQGK
jgi:hypothetical protein